VSLISAHFSECSKCTTEAGSLAAYAVDETVYPRRSAGAWNSVLAQ